MAIILVIPAGYVYGENGQTLSGIAYLGKQTSNAYLTYLDSRSHKAFAIAPGGSWGWAADHESHEQAIKKARITCEQHTTGRCILYAIDDQVVLNQDEWAALWSPYLSKEQAAQQRLGRKVGERLYDLEYLDSNGQSHTISELRGKVVLLHFWASWCPPCAAELPSLKSLYHEINMELSGQVEMILLQARESYLTAKTWAEKRGFGDLPIRDSMYDGDEDVVRLAGGSSLPDRYLAQAFPSTYVIDQNGIILFAHTGPIFNWPAYLSLLRHAVNSGYGDHESIALAPVSTDTTH